jgi:hypothetical protein
MPTRKTSRRKCRDHEKEWNGFCVDKNLDDDWLARLNNLAAFNLISICEGHCGRPTEPSKARPHVKLKLKERLLPGVAAHWSEHKVALVHKVNELFQAGDTYVNLELKFKLRTATSRLNYEESLVVRIHSREVRTFEEMDARIVDWFQRGVSRVEALDDFVAALWNDINQTLS